MIPITNIGSVSAVAQSMVSTTEDVTSEVSYDVLTADAFSAAISMLIGVVLSCDGFVTGS